VKQEHVKRIVTQLAARSILVVKRSQCF